MPQTIQKMMEEHGLKAEVEQSTYSGMSLSSHLSRVQTAEGQWRRTVDTEISPTVRTLLSKDWDIVVLQEGVKGLLMQEYQQYNYEPAIIGLDSLIEQKKERPSFISHILTKIIPNR